MAKFLNMVTFPTVQRTISKPLTDLKRCFNELSIPLRLQIAHPQSAMRVQGTMRVIARQFRIAVRLDLRHAHIGHLEGV